MNRTLVSFLQKIGEPLKIAQFRIFPFHILIQQFKHKVWLLSGGPTIIIGMEFKTETKTMNRFSFSVLVKAIVFDFSD
jgi:hypothetical protein